MVALFKKLSIFFLSIYIMSLYIFQYNAELNIISHILFAVFFAVSCAYIFLRGEFILSSSYINLFAFGILALLSYFWAIDKSIVVGRNRTLFILIALAIIIINVINDEESLKQCIKAIFIGGMIMCLYSLLYYGLNQTFNSIFTGDRLGADINQENSFGLYCGITFSISIFYALYERKRLCYLLSILPLIYAIASGSRQAILVIIIGFGILICFKITKRKLLNIILTIVFSLVLLYLLCNLFIYYNIFERFTYLFNFITGRNGFVDNSILTRIRMIEMGLQAFLKNPVLGYGTDQYNFLYFNYFGQYRPSHNTYIEVMVNYGIVGFVIYYSIFYKIIRAAFRNIDKSRNLSILIITICAIYLTTHFTTNTIYDKFAYVYLALGIAYKDFRPNINNNDTDK